MRTTLVYVLAAFAEIAGCFSFWAWLRGNHSALWLVPGMFSLALFAWLLTLVDSAFAGRAYAAYGSVYITASLVWLWAVEGSNQTDGTCLARVSRWRERRSSSSGRGHPERRR
jgi:small multidrug resistance family-3 protein